jgi:hypothetical protein
MVVLLDTLLLGCYAVSVGEQYAVMRYTNKLQGSTSLKKCNICTVFNSVYQVCKINAN